jgi:hypothetical protein
MTVKIAPIPANSTAGAMTERRGSLLPVMDEQVGTNGPDLSARRRKQGGGPSPSALE